MPLRRALDTLIIDLPMGHLEGNLLDDFALRITVRFAARLAFIVAGITYCHGLGHVTDFVYITLVFRPHSTPAFLLLELSSIPCYIIRRFKGILNKLSRRLNKERIKIFIIIIIIIVFESSLI